MNILVLAHYYPPDENGWIAHSVALAMKDRGRSVKVLTGYPHYMEGKVSHGYRQKWRFEEIIDGIKVRRVPIFPSHSRNPMGRIANYLSFVMSCRLAGDFVDQTDVIYVDGAPATVAEPARAWARSKGVPFVYHVQDIWPESVTESGFLPERILEYMRWGLNKWLGRVYEGAAAVVSIAPTAKALMIERGVPEHRAHLIYNWTDLVETSSPEFTPGLSLLYAGNLGDFQDLDTVVRAAVPLADLPNFRLRIAGSGIAEDRLKKLVRDLKLENVVEFLGRLERDQMPALYAESDFQIVSLQDKEFFTRTIPSKLQVGLAHGIPVITTVKGDVTKIVSENQLGFTALPEDVDSLSKVFLGAYNTSLDERHYLSGRAKAFYAANFSSDIAMDRLENILFSAATMGRKPEWSDE